jgi:hypothetical protein
MTEAETARANADVLAKFERRISPEPNCGCWLWHGYADQDGYGKFQYNKRCEKAHNTHHYPERKRKVI